MSKLNRVYQNTQVEFSLCSCLKQIVKAQNRDIKSPIDQQSDKRLIYQSHINRQSSKNKNGWLKLSKNIAAEQQYSNSITKQFKTHEHYEVLKQQPIITNRPSVIPLIKLLQPSFVEQKGKSTDVKFSFPTTFRQSHKEQINYNQNQLKNNQNLTQQRHFLQYLQSQQKLKKQTKDQYPLFSSTNLRTTCNQTISVPCSKYNSTSSTTLFETKNLLQECLNKQKNKPIQQQKQEKIKQRSRVVGNRKIYSENIGLNIVDFSRVREVQTVMSESFSLSYIDVASEIHASSSNLIIGKQIQKQFNTIQMENQMKRLLLN